MAMKNACPKRMANIKTTSLPDGYAVLVNEKTNWAHTIGPLAALVWEFCDGHHNELEIVKSLQSIPELEDRVKLAEEVRDVIQEFCDGGFIEEDE